RRRRHRTRRTAAASTASATAPAAAGGIGGAGEPVPAVEPGLPAPEGAAPPSSAPPPVSPEKSSPAGDAEDYVVSEEVNPDPEEVLRYWSEERTENAQPMPMPVVEGPVDVTE
ncbi:hypothetical protein ACFOWE_26165, partial [Planomonospora corallina]